MDNILYIGPYREFSGMGNASRAYIKSLIQSGHNISIRPIYNLHKDYPESDIAQDIIELESNFSKKYHKIIQHCFPHQFVYDNRFDQHIGILHLESYNYGRSVMQYCDIMDNIVVGSKFVQRQVEQFSRTPVSIIPEPIDLNEISTYREKNVVTSKNSNFNFYVIGNLVAKKNLEKILLCFLKLSLHYDNIDLVLKIKSYLGDDMSVQAEIEYLLSKLHAAIGNNNVKKIKMLIGETSQEGIYYIHNNNHCFINANSGDSFGYSTLEALAFNNNIIVNKKTASEEITEGVCDLVVDTEKTMCVDSARLFPAYNSTLQMWEDPVINSLYSNMSRAIIETEKEKNERILRQQHKIIKYDIPYVAELWSKL